MKEEDKKKVEELFNEQLKLFNLMSRAMNNAAQNINKVWAIVAKDKQDEKEEQLPIEKELDMIGSEKLEEEAEKEEEIEQELEEEAEEEPKEEKKSKPEPKKQKRGLFRKKIIDGAIDKCGNKKCRHNKQLKCNYKGGLKDCDSFIAIG